MADTLQPADILRNIRRAYSGATSEERELGARWYSDARQFCRSLASEYGITSDVAASVVAALSPNCSWPLNKRDAMHLLEVFRAGLPMLSANVATYKANLVKAWRIRETGDCSILHGPKVMAFRDCILSPNSRAVCIDSHTYCVASGKEYTTQTMPHISRANWQAIADCFRRVARQYHVAPYRVQATCWIVRRRTNDGGRNQISLPLR